MVTDMVGKTSWRTIRRQLPENIKLVFHGSHMVEKDHVATDYNDMGEYNIFFIMERRLKWNIIKSCY